MWNIEPEPIVFDAQRSIFVCLQALIAYIAQNLFVQVTATVNI